MRGRFAQHICRELVGIHAMELVGDVRDHDSIVALQFGHDAQGAVGMQDAGLGGVHDQLAHDDLHKARRVHVALLENKIHDRFSELTERRREDVQLAFANSLVPLALHNFGLERVDGHMRGQPGLTNRLCKLDKLVRAACMSSTVIK